MTNEIRVKTLFNHEKIDQTWEMQVGDHISVIHQQVILLSDKAVREALIQLGWTPPKE